MHFQRTNRAEEEKRPFFGFVCLVYEGLWKMGSLPRRHLPLTKEHGWTYNIAWGQTHLTLDNLFTGKRDVIDVNFDYMANSPLRILLVVFVYFNGHDCHAHLTTFKSCRYKGGYTPKIRIHSLFHFKRVDSCSIRRKNSHMKTHIKWKWDNVSGWCKNTWFWNIFLTHSTVFLCRIMIEGNLHYLNVIKQLFI